MAVAARVSPKDFFTADEWAPFAARSPFMKHRIGRKRGKIEFLGPWLRLIFVVAHALRSRIPWVELVLAMNRGAWIVAHDGS